MDRFWAGMDQRVMKCDEPFVGHLIGWRMAFGLHERREYDTRAAQIDFITNKAFQYQISDCSILLHSTLQ